jgi:DNA-binding NarL/FixJ family response regulator
MSETIAPDRSPVEIARQGARSVRRHSVGPTRVLLADRQTLVLEALCAFLAPDHRVVGCVRDGFALVEQALRLQPDLVVSELRLPGLDGLEAARRVLQGCRRLRFVFLTSAEDEGQAEQAFAAGAAGFLLKCSSGAEFVSGLREVMRGGRALSRGIASGWPAGRAAGPSGQAGPGRQPLSPRAAEVVRLLALGRTMKQAAYELGITPRTVAYHKYAAMHVLGIGSSAELVRFAVSAGMVGAPELSGGA